MRLIIIGASGHGKVVADVAKRTYDEIVFLDNDPEIKACAGHPVLGPDTMASELEGDVFVAVGNADDRKNLMERNKDRVYPVLIHPSAVVADGVEIGDGSVVMAGTVINPGARIGRGSIINTCSSVDHDCRIGDYCHISVGAHLSGTVVLGSKTWIGAGATVANNVTISPNVVIGAGGVVIKDIPEPGIYVGVPINKKIGG